MRKFLSVFVLCGVFISCDKKYDCPEDYKGWIVAREESWEEYTLKNDCSYEKVKFPYLYDWRIGDTVGVSLTWRQEIDKSTKEMDAIIHEFDSLMVEINKIR